MSEQDWFTKDFYRELGVDKNADDAAIKKAYRKLARKYHPDHNPGDASAEARFKEISEAYTVLSDKQQRQKYDAIRQMAGGGARFAPGGSAGFEDLFSGMFGGGFGAGRGPGGGQRFEAGNVDDILGGLFGGGFSGGTNFGGANFGGGGARFSTHHGGPFGAQHGESFGGGFGAGQPQPQRGADLKSSVTLTFRQALKGSEIRLKVNGKQVNARIPAGVKDGQKIKLAGKGKPGTHGGKAGDLVITVSVTPHPVIARDGHNLHMTVPITLREATQGTDLNVPLWDGSTITVKVPAGTTSGTTLRVAGRGVASSKGTGDLLVEVVIAVPSSLSDQAQAAVAEFTAHTADFDPRATLASQVASA